MTIADELRAIATRLELGNVKQQVTVEDVYEEIIGRLELIKQSWNNKSQWHQDLGSKFLDIYIEDYKEKIKAEHH